MGMPVSERHQALVHGARCVFSNGVPIIGERTRRTATNQIGNSMHVNSIGATTMLTTLLVPMLGSRNDGKKKKKIKKIKITGKASELNRVLGIWKHLGA